MATKAASKKKDVLPQKAARTVEQIVDELLAGPGVAELGVPVSEEQLAKKYQLIAPRHFEGKETVKRRCTVLTNPNEEWFVNEALAGAVPEYLGTQIFAVNVIDERKLDSLSLAWDRVGDEDGCIDLGYLSAFTMRIRVNHFEGRKSPTLPMKKDGIVVNFELTDRLDELGQPIIEEVSFRVLAAERGEGVTLRRGSSAAGGNAGGDGATEEPEVAATARAGLPGVPEMAGDGVG